MSTTTFTTDLVWDPPTGELHRLNEQKLRDMGISAERTRALMRDPWYSLAVLTTCVTALEQLADVSGREAVVVFAASAASEDQARLVADSLRMLAHYHRTMTPLTSLAASGPITARDRHGGVVSQPLWTMLPGPLAWRNWPGILTSRLRNAMPG